MTAIASGTVQHQRGVGAHLLRYRRVTTVFAFLAGIALTAIGPR